MVESLDRVALVDLRNLAAPPVVLEASAARIWSVIDGLLTTDDVVEAVAGSFGIATADVRDDVVAFLGTLAAAGLIEEVV